MLSPMSHNDIRKRRKTKFIDDDHDSECDEGDMLVFGDEADKEWYQFFLACCLYKQDIFFIFLLSIMVALVLYNVSFDMMFIKIKYVIICLSII